jgi:hypothetical protein
MEDAETKARVKETVLKILHGSNMDEVTESKIRKQASTELDLNLNQPPFKALVKQIIEDFLVEKQQQQQKEEEEKQREKEEEEVEEEEEEKQEVKQKGVSSKSNVYVDSGDLVICEVCFVFFYFFSPSVSLVNDESIRKRLSFCFNFVFRISAYEKEKGDHSGFQREKVCLHSRVLHQGWQGTSF